jgi:hypothetical protein
MADCPACGAGNAGDVETLLRRRGRLILTDDQCALYVFPDPVVLFRRDDHGFAAVGRSLGRRAGTYRAPMIIKGGPV